MKALKMQTFDNKAAAYYKLYNDLWEQANKYCLDNLKGNDLTYYIQTTD